MTSTDAEPGHVEAVLVALAILAPTFMVFIVVGPHEPVVYLGLGLYVVLLVVGVALTAVLDRV